MTDPDLTDEELDQAQNDYRAAMDALQSRADVRSWA